LSEMIRTGWRRLNQLRQGAAWLLCAAFFLMVPLEFSLLDWQRTPHGTWLIAPVENLSAGQMAVLAVWGIILMAGSMVFVLCGCLLRFSQERRLLGSELEARDIVYFTAWVQTFQIALPLLLVLLPEQGETEALSLLASYFPFMWICLVSLFLLRGKWREIGCVSVDAAFWVKVPLVIVGLYLFFVLVVDRHLTEWFADLCSLELSSWREESISRGIEQAGQSHPVLLLLQWITIGLIGPIAEEILFRGYLQGWLTKHVGAVAGVGASAMLFALFHIDVALFPGLFLLGVVMGWLRVWTKTLWAPIMFHCLNNAVATWVDMSASISWGYF
jgi:uncharacterized protein